LFLEIFGDIFVHLLAEERRVRNVVLSVLAYAVAGSLAGYLSLLVFPSHFIRREDLRFVNVIVTPLAVAAIMSWVGRSRERHDKRVVRLEHFGYAYVFAVSIGLVRLFGAS
jgi:hypothetical protein